LSDEEKIKELIERIQRLSKKGQEVDARMKKVEQTLLDKKIRK
jgi:hypothetical protein